MNGRRVSGKQTAFVSLLAGLLSAVTFLFVFVPPATQAQTAVPTRDRLAAPPTVPAPTQADEGAQLYWLHCQPCHGDVGQGLTDAPDDDWRAQYPPEDQYCWNSGCHGARPYEDGFTIPKEIPSVIGEDSLSRFTNMEDVYSFMRAAMPFQVPASLTDEEYLKLTAFLVRENEVGDARVLTKDDLATIQLNPAYNEAVSTVEFASSPAANELDAVQEKQPVAIWAWLVSSAVVLMIILGGLLWLRHGR